MKINVVIGLVAAACAIAAPSKGQLECKPHKEVKDIITNQTVAMKGFLTLASYHRGINRNSSGVHASGGSVGTLQPSDGKLKVSGMSEDDLEKDGKQFQLMSCNAKGKEYHDEKIVPGHPLMNKTVVRGQLKSGDKCVTMKDGTMTLEKCATTEEDLKPQTIEIMDDTIVKMHGKNSSSLIVDMDGSEVAKVREWNNENDTHYLMFEDTPSHDVEGLSDGAAKQGATMALLAVALVALWSIV